MRVILIDVEIEVNMPYLSGVYSCYKVPFESLNFCKKGKSLKWLGRMTEIMLS